MEYEIIKGWISDKFSYEIIVKALKEAVYNQVTNLNYIDKILYDWNKKGIKNKEKNSIKNAVLLSSMTVKRQIGKSKIQKQQKAFCCLFISSASDNTACRACRCIRSI